MDLSQSKPIMLIIIYNPMTPDYYTNVLKYNKIHFGSIGLSKALNSLSEIWSKYNLDNAYASRVY